MPTEPPFGRLLTAMVTPFTDDGSAVDLDAAAALAVRLVDEGAHDGLVINGTGGEAPTTSDAEKADLVRAVVDAVGDRASIVAGVGTFSTHHTLSLAADAEKAGADGLLVVTPYYSKPPQAGLLEHFRMVADGTGLPIMIYDIPHRAGTAIATETMLRLAEHPRIAAVKDAKSDLGASSRVIAETELAYYSGNDDLTLPLLAVGSVGLVGTSTHFCGREAKSLIEAYVGGDHATALAAHQRLLAVFTGVFATQGCMMVKGTLHRRGQGNGVLRPPMVTAADAELDAFAASLATAGL